MWKILILFNILSFISCQRESTGGDVTPTGTNGLLLTASYNGYGTKPNSTSAVPSISTPPSALPTSVTPTLRPSSASILNPSITQSVVMSTSINTTTPSTVISSSIMQSTSSINASSSIMNATSSITTSSIKNVTSTYSTAHHTNISQTLSPTSIQPSSVSSQQPMSSTVTPTTTPETIYECGEECKSLRKKLYAAASFSILFVIVAIILGVLLYRQYRISRDYRDDPSLSRLI